jgi:hypothetical protein
MMKDPGWAVVQAHLDSAQTGNGARWSNAWREAVAAGWSPRTDHHHALLFARFCADLVAAQDFEVARYCWEECIAAWLRVFDSDYVDAWLEQVGAADLKTRRRLLGRLVDARVDELSAGLSLGNSNPNTAVDRRLTRFAWEALNELQGRIEASKLEDPALVGLGQRIERARADIVSRLMRRFAQMIDALDLSAPDIDAIMRPFQWAGDVFRILPIDASVAARVADAAVDIGWKLRKLKLDDIDKSMTRLLKSARRFNDELERFIQAGEAFGHNSTCADFLVFRGEHRARSAGREKYFARAIAVCPGHRNASMMLSYEKLRALSDLLLKVRMVPSAIRVLPGTATRVDSALEQARVLLDEAEELYPSNEAIAEYRRQLAHEADRLGAEASG